METLVFVGTDKNAGKTTAFNFVYQSLNEAGRAPLVLTSIGINGESVDAFIGREKPRIRIKAKTHFVTAASQLKGLSGAIAVKRVFVGPPWTQAYALCEALLEVNAVLEGPNSRDEVQELKKALVSRELFQAEPKACLLIDGSIDRRFLAHPAVSDGIYLSYALVRKDGFRGPGRRELVELILRLKTCSEQQRNHIDSHLKVRDAGDVAGNSARTLLLGDDGRLLYESSRATLFNDELMRAIEKACCGDRGEGAILYLPGAVTAELSRDLHRFSRLTVVLESITQVQGGLSAEAFSRTFVYHKPKVRAVFVKDEDVEQMPASFLATLQCPVINLYREEAHGVRV